MAGKPRRQRALKAWETRRRKAALGEMDARGWKSKPGFESEKALELREDREAKKAEELARGLGVSVEVSSQSAVPSVAYASNRDGADRGKGRINLPFTSTPGGCAGP